MKWHANNAVGYEVLKPTMPPPPPQGHCVRLVRCQGCRKMAKKPAKKMASIMENV